MAKRSVSVAVPLAAAQGAAVDVSDLVSVSISLTGTFDATYQVMVSYDNGVSFSQQGSDHVDTAFNVTIPDAATQVALNCTEYTSGTPKGGLAGVKA